MWNSRRSIATAVGMLIFASCCPRQFLQIILIHQYRCCLCILHTTAVTRTESQVPAGGHNSYLHQHGRCARHDSSIEHRQYTVSCGLLKQCEGKLPDALPEGVHALHFVCVAVS